jgi:hypothetical protein
MREELQMARASGKVVRGERDDSDFKTSTKFFKTLQSEVQQSLRGDDDNSGKKRKLGEDQSTKSSKFKL